MRIHLPGPGRAAALALSRQARGRAPAAWEQLGGIMARGSGRSDGAVMRAQRVVSGCSRTPLLRIAVMMPTPPAYRASTHQQLARLAAGVHVRTSARSTGNGTHTSVQPPVGWGFWSPSMVSPRHRACLTGTRPRTGPEAIWQWHGLRRTVAARLAAELIHHTLTLSLLASSRFGRGGVATVA